MTTIHRRRGQTAPARSGLTAVLCALALLLAACLPPSGQTRSVGHIDPPPPLARLDAGLAAVPGPLPFPFEANVGQVAPDVAFPLRSGDLTAGFGTGTVTYVLTGAEQAAGQKATPTDEPAHVRRTGSADRPVPAVRSLTVRQELVGARPAPPAGTVAAETTVSYIVGPAASWKRGVPAYHEIAYAEPWPGIAVTYVRAGRGLKSTYHLEAGAEPAQIRLAYRGGDVRLAEDGALEIVTPLGLLRDSAPVAWQERDGQRTPVAAGWEIVSEPDADEAEVGFRLGAYDPTTALVIDPNLLYATYIGGSGGDDGVGIAVDGSGAVYVTGHTSSTQSRFPDGDRNGNGQIDAPGSDRSFNGANDAFVAKLAPDGRSLVYLTASPSIAAGRRTSWGYVLTASDLPDREWLRRPARFRSDVQLGPGRLRGEARP